MGLVLAAAAILNVAAGAVFIPPETVLKILLRSLSNSWGTISAGADWPQAYEVILLKIRLPHMVLAALSGAALAGSGAAFQGLFRNPLADPYLIGVASGAGLGAVVVMAVREISGDAGLGWVPAGAFGGALITVLVVYILAGQRGTSTTPLILAGVAVSAFASSLTSFLMLRSQGELYRAVAWLMGGSSQSGWEPVISMMPYVVVGLGGLLAAGQALNVLQFGEEQAQQLGVAVPRTKAFIVLAASLATAAAVAFSGIIGFIGLIVPHLARIRWGGDYRRLIPLSILGGAAALLLADLAARLVLAPQELPVGIITALVGGPFFLWVLRHSRKD
jgi:iron complex transport system permease protein